MPDRQVGDVGMGSLATLELLADLGDVLEPATAGVGVEAEPQRDLGRREQGELRGGVVLGHAPIMKRGCGSRTSAQVGSVPEGGVLGIDADDSYGDAVQLEFVDHRFHPPQRHRVDGVQPGQVEVE